MNGYSVDENLRLREIKTGKPFRFVNQADYDELGRAVTHHIQHLMVEAYGMRKIELPLKRDVPPWTKVNGKEKCPVFLSKNAMEAKRLLILICGSGQNVYAGLWSRKLCINDCFQRGSVLPFLDWAHARNIAVLVLNPNYPDEVVTMGEKMAIGTAHVIYAWDAICASLPAERIAIVGHSAGGHDACELIKHREKEVLKRLRCVAFGDTIQLCINRLSNEGKMFLVDNGMDWVVSQKPLDTVIRKSTSGKGKDQLFNHNCKEVSAGTTKHVDVIMSAFDSICSFVLKKLDDL